MEYIDSIDHGLFKDSSLSLCDISTIERGERKTNLIFAIQKLQ